MNSIKILITLIICLSSVNLISARARTNGSYSPEYRKFKDYVSASGIISNFTVLIPKPEIGKEHFSIPLDTDGKHQENETQVSNDAERLQNGNGCRCPGMDQEYGTNKKYASIVSSRRRGDSPTNDNGCQCPIIEYYPNVARDAERKWNDNGDRCPRINQEHETLVIRITKRKRNVDDFRSPRKGEKEGVLPGVEVTIG